MLLHLIVFLPQYMIFILFNASPDMNFHTLQAVSPP
jgi:hypothetical protein